MNIQSTKNNFSTVRTSTLQKTEGPKAQTGPTGDTMTFGDSAGKTALGFLASGSVMVGGIGSATFAGMKASQFMPTGGGGLTSAVTGLVMGAIAGGATGMGLAALSEKFDPSDAAGDAMMSGMLTMGGAVVGGIAGAISGFVGAEALLVAPATVGAGFVGAGLPAFAFSKVLD